MSTNKNKLSKNKFYMLLALKQAEKALGNTGQNPAVGCITVKNDSVIGSGFTGYNGRPHAEVNAIKNSTSKIISSNIFVTLEPCSHYGVTPPCTKSIIKKKIKKVFFSSKDPDPRSYNKSSKIFKKNGIFVNSGLLKNQANNFYRSYFKYKEKHMPYVTAKLAISEDFFTINKKKSWITNKYSRGRVHLMRSQNDCILTSVNTVIKDNPLLTCRIKGLENRSPVRFILDKDLKIPLKSNIILSSKIKKTFIFFNKMDEKKIGYLKRKKINLIKVPLTNNNFNLSVILQKIALLGFSRVFLESGINLVVNFLKDNLIDELHLFISGKKLGVNGGNNFKKYTKMIPIKGKFNNKINLLGDKLLSYIIK